MTAEIRSPFDAPAFQNVRGRVEIRDDCVLVESLVVDDAAAAGALRDKDPDECIRMVGRALRIGLLAIEDAAVGVNVDLVRREFEELLRRTSAANDRAQVVLEASIREAFGANGQLPQTMERFLGDKGELRGIVDDLFDDQNKASAISKIQTALGAYFDGEDSRLVQLLDTDRPGAPLYAFRQEMEKGLTEIADRISRLEGAKSERRLGTAKGTDFESRLLAPLGDLARAAKDELEVTGTTSGAIRGSKKGDFVLTMNRMVTRGADLRVVIEAKDRGLSASEIRSELREARENRLAVQALIVFTPTAAPVGVAPFDLRDGDVYCVVDPENPDLAILEAAVVLARLLALSTLSKREASHVDVELVRRAVASAQRDLAALSPIKAKVTKAANEINSDLDRLARAIGEHLADASCELERALAEESVVVPQSA